MILVKYRKQLLYGLLTSSLVFLGSCEPSTQPQTARDISNQATATDGHGPARGEAEGDFRVLFDENSLSGWHGYGGADATSRWWVNDGVLAVKGLGDGQVDLVTDAEFGNFDLRLEWKISEGGNSGIIFNVAETPEYNRSWKTGPELQILDNDGHPDSSTKHRAGDLYDLLSSTQEMSRPVGEWNESRLLVENGLLKHWLNGTLVIEVQMWNENWNEMVAKSKFGSMPGFGKYFSGHIVLQDHGDVVAFRNIRIREQ
ncbi:MAG: DUF1080 domain-containing protein [Gammaproteobacteria bacterium]|nr:DUF1080 domain-containing protein [Gammaproteobacteria bacterium]